MQWSLRTFWNQPGSGKFKSKSDNSWNVADHISKGGYAGKGTNN